ncbi:MAG TPA: sulfurtransferase TusA family protein [Nitrososphaeraceae archaeon]|jgi:TusA-related sulfurtransferase|nr:sulfurtransferase TusA family protein [Nitrososphaeraceae archaeon]
MSTTTNNNNSPTKTIDVRGLFCPEPVFRTKIEMERLKTGDMLKIISDDPESEEDISRWVKRNGHELLLINKTQKDLEFIIKKAK